MSPWSALVWQSSLRCIFFQWTAAAAATTIATINLKIQVKVWLLLITAAGHYVIQVKETRSNNRRATTTTQPTRSHSLPTFLLCFRALLTGLATRSHLLAVVVVVVVVATKKGLLSKEPLHCLPPVGHWSPLLLSGTFSPSPSQLPSELSISHFLFVCPPSLDSFLAALLRRWFSALSARHLIPISFYLTFGMACWLPFALSAHFR